ncbi:hypothetical protein QBC44DRAFT_401412, partial [Cladorrhinum sp. PSN332]
MLSSSYSSSCHADMDPATQLNVTLRYIGPFGFDKPYELLREALQNTSDPLGSPYLKQAAGGYISFTNEACLAMTDSSRSAWEMYPHQDIWNRIVTWKLPLVTLLFQLPRPPFPFRWWTNPNVFIMMQLVGNPISTIASLLVTVNGCQQRAKAFRQHIAMIHKRLERRGRSEMAKQLQQKSDVLCNRFALIQVSCDEWEVEGAFQFLTTSLTRLYLEEESNERFMAVMRHFDVTAESLASDRATYILPIFIALFAFIASIGAAYWRIVGSPPEPGLWINVEAYSIAMSAPFLYVVPAVFLGGVVGVSQTERSVPRELNKLRLNLEQEGWLNEKDDLLFPRVKNNTANIFHRIYHGGMYSWRPDLLLPGRLSSTWPHILLAFLIVFFSIFVAGWISYQVPPEGFDCRNAGQASLFGVWLLSFVFDYVLTIFMVRLGCNGKNAGYWYEITFVKEVIMGTSAILVILLVQFGIFNRCDCFTLWGKVPLALPEIPEVAAVLMHRIAFEWPAVTFGWIGIEMVFCVVIWRVYQDAFDVYNQEDG